VVPTRMLVVWCPDWPVAAAGIAADTAAAVFRANRAVACSPAARAEGVTRGLRRREAQARCPHLVVLEHDPTRDARVFEPIVAAVERFAPRVEIVRPGLCAVPTRGPSRYFGGDEALAVAVGEAVFAASGHRCRVGIADGHFAAALAARQGRIVATGEVARFLAPFPVRTLERPDLADLLARLGIRTLGQFAAIGPEDVLARFGADGALAHRLARGLDERPPATRTPPPDLVVERELDPPAHRVDTAAFVGKALADELHERLAGMGLACTRVAVEAETAHGESLSRLWRHEGAPSAAAIAERVRWQLDGWLTALAQVVAPDYEVDDVDAAAGLTMLRLVPDEVVPDNGRQAGFWGGAGEEGERAARAMARVQGLLGPDAVVTAVLSGARAPGEQATYVPWGDPREPPPRPPVPPWPGRLPSPSPATVYPEPLPADVRDEGGQAVRVTGRNAVSAPPARIALDGARPDEVTAWAGPWPVDERWWDPPAHRRRARFQVRVSSGAAYLLAVENGRWLVEASYD
jgi:protein ImuB